MYALKVTVSLRALHQRISLALAKEGGTKPWPR